MTVDEIIVEIKKDNNLLEIAGLISACQFNSYSMDDTMDAMIKQYPKYFKALTDRKFQMLLNKCPEFAEAYYLNRFLMRDKLLYIAYNTAKTSKDVRDMTLVYDRLSGISGEVNIEDVVEIEKISKKTQDTLERLIYEGNRFIESIDDESEDEDDMTE